MTEAAAETPTDPFTRGAAFFLAHALRLISDQCRHSHPDDPFAEPIEVGLARVSAVLRLAEGRTSGFTPAEREALAEALRVAGDLAIAARLDPRWERLALPGDPVRELRAFRQTIMSPAAPTGLGRSLAA
jgi:hypothetical protein